MSELQKTIEQAIRRAIASTIVNSSVNGVDTHMGIPTDEQHQKIMQMTGTDSQPEDWFVCCVRASDNLVNRSLRAWHPNVLNQMQEAYQGKTFLLDHEWDESNDAIGFIYDCNLIDGSPAEEAINQPGKAEFNKSIIENQGYKALYLNCAIHSSLQSIIDGITSRRLNGCSTGGLLSGVRMICPNCTEEKGRETTFTETDKNGDYVCPHQIPSVWSMMYADDDEDEDDDSPGYADYLLLDGEYDCIETSLVNAPNLPNAGIVR